MAVPSRFNRKVWTVDHCTTSPPPTLQPILASTLQPLPTSSSPSPPSPLSASLPLACYHTCKLGVESTVLLPIPTDLELGIPVIIHPSFPRQPSEFVSLHQYWFSTDPQFLPRPSPSELNPVERPFNPLQQPFQISLHVGIHYGTHKSER